MKALGLIGLITMALATSSLAQGTPPKVGGKPVVQVKPKAPPGCKLVGTAKGVKIWAGECMDATEMRGSAPATEVAPVAPAGEKQ
jgi:hypothetical protein